MPKPHPPRYGSQGHSDRVSGKSTLRKRQPVATESGRHSGGIPWDEEQDGGDVTWRMGLPGLGYVVEKTMVRFCFLVSYGSGGGKPFQMAMKMAPINWGL